MLIIKKDNVEQNFKNIYLEERRGRGWDWKTDFVHFPTCYKLIWQLFYVLLRLNASCCYDVKYEQKEFHNS